MSDDPYAGTVVPVSDATYVARVIDHPGPVLLAFLRSPSSSRQAMMPVLSQVAQARADTLRVAAVDVAASPVTAERWGVTENPTLLYFDHGVLQRVLLGVRPAARLLDEIG
jgi:thioredoxin